MKHYRALISIPISASSDDAARTAAEQQAASLLDSTGSGVMGQVELIGETGDDEMEIIRPVWADGWLQRQLPPDWKP